MRVRGTALGSLLVVPNSERAHGGRRQERGVCVCAWHDRDGGAVLATRMGSHAHSHRTLRLLLAPLPIAKMPLLCAWWGALGAWCVCVCVCVCVCGMRVVLCLRWEATLAPSALCSSSRAISHREMPPLEGGEGEGRAAENASIVESRAMQVACWHGKVDAHSHRTLRLFSRHSPSRNAPLGGWGRRGKRH